MANGHKGEKWQRLINFDSLHAALFKVLFAHGQEGAREAERQCFVVALLFARTVCPCPCACGCVCVCADVSARVWAAAAFSKFNLLKLNAH